MRNFLIGHHGSFDEKKQHRDFKQGFFGVQACLLESIHDIEKLLRASRENNFQIGVHFPFRAGEFSFRDPLFLSLEQEVRNDAFASAAAELEYLKDIKPAFVLFHYPKPVILDDAVDWRLWRFGDSSEYIYQSAYPFEELKERSEALFEWLSNKSEAYHFTPVLELDALNKYIYETTLLEDLLVKYPRIKLCLDTGRLHMQNRLDRNFDAEAIIKRFAKYTELVHLWNVKVTEKVEYNHYPVLPELHPKDGWGPIDRYLKILRGENSSCLMMFEHRSELIGDEQLEACYNWVNRMMNE